MSAVHIILSYSFQRRSETRLQMFSLITVCLWKIGETQFIRFQRHLTSCLLISSSLLFQLISPLQNPNLPSPQPRWSRPRSPFPLLERADREASHPRSPTSPSLLLQTSGSFVSSSLFIRLTWMKLFKPTFTKSFHHWSLFLLPVWFSWVVSFEAELSYSFILFNYVLKLS